MVSSSVAEPDFAKARELINSLKPNINYDQFCLGKLISGQLKSACRIAQVPSVVLLFCKIDVGSCKKNVDQEIKNLQKLNEGGVRTVKFDKEMIMGVKCSDSLELTCDGFLEEWIDENVGWFRRLDTYFRGGTVKVLLKDVRKKITTPEGRKKTANDLKKIREYMVAPQGKHHLICDLQGFFLFAGGFLVSDPDGIKENKTLQQKCENDPHTEPTTEQVLDGLELLIRDLPLRKWDKKNVDFVHTQKRKCHMYELFNDLQFYTVKTD